MKSAHDLFSSLSYHIRLNNSILTEASDNSHLKRNFSIAFALKGTEMSLKWHNDPDFNINESC